MTDLPLHPAVVHVPLGLAIAMPVLAIAVAVAMWRWKLPRLTLALVTVMQLLLACGAFAAMEVGLGEEKQATQFAPRNAVQDHKAAAESFVWGSFAVLFVSIASLFVPARRVPLLAALVAAGSVVVAGLAVDAGRKGGELVFRYGARVQTDPTSSASAPLDP